MIVTVALAIAIVSITLAVRVITPLVLTLLSIALGPRLREAASKVEHAGRKAVDAVLRVQRAMGEGMPTPVVAEVRVEPDGSATASGHGVRVAADDRAETRADPDDREDENSEARERRRSTP